VLDGCLALAPVLLVLEGDQRQEVEGTVVMWIALEDAHEVRDDLRGARAERFELLELGLAELVAPWLERIELREDLARAEGAEIAPLHRVVIPGDGRVEGHEGALRVRERSSLGAQCAGVGSALALSREERKGQRSEQHRQEGLDEEQRARRRRLPRPGVVTPDLRRARRERTTGEGEAEQGDEREGDRCVEQRCARQRDRHERNERPCRQQRESPTHGQEEAFAEHEEDNEEAQHPELGEELERVAVRPSHPRRPHPGALHRELDFGWITMGREAAREVAGTGSERKLLEGEIQNRRVEPLAHLERGGLGIEPRGGSARCARVGTHGELARRRVPEPGRTEQRAQDGQRGPGEDQASRPGGSRREPDTRHNEERQQESPADQRRASAVGAEVDPQHSERGQRQSRTQAERGRRGEESPLRSGVAIAKGADGLVRRGVVQRPIEAEALRDAVDRAHEAGGHEAEQQRPARRGTARQHERHEGQGEPVAAAFDPEPAVVGPKQRENGQVRQDRETPERPTRPS
jgi:hypothetical protein